MEEKREGINFFQKYLTLWVLICMGVGVFLGKVFPQMTSFVSGLQIEGISVPIAILIWIMIYPMMIKIDFESIKEVGKNPKGLFVTWITNWLIKPFTMFGISYLFFFIIFKNFDSRRPCQGLSSWCCFAWGSTLYCHGICLEQLN